MLPPLGHPPFPHRYLLFLQTFAGELPGMWTLHSVCNCFKSGAALCPSQMLLCKKSTNFPEKRCTRSPGQSCGASIWFHPLYCVFFFSVTSLELAENSFGCRLREALLAAQHTGAFFLAEFQEGLCSILAFESWSLTSSQKCHSVTGGHCWGYTRLLLWSCISNFDWQAPPPELIPPPSSCFCLPSLALRATRVASKGTVIYSCLPRNICL